MSDRMHFVRRAAGALTIAVIALTCAACGENDPGAIGATGLSEVSKEQQRQDYQGAMLAMTDALEDPSAMPMEQAINTGNRKELQDAARRWDQATAVVISIEAPENVVSFHEKLGKAMQDLGDWNRRIAAAAPNKAATRRLGRQARESDAARRYNEALGAIQGAGYEMIPEDPLDSAGAPGE
jgi:hypothetical protein